MTRMKRRDAVENHERLLVAAFDILADRGPDLSVRETALRSGLGVGTAYRHFATHEDLIRAAYDRALTQVGAVFMQDTSADSAWGELCMRLEAVTLAIADVPAVRTVMRLMHEIDPSYSPANAAAVVVERVIRAAEEEGALRAGVAPADLAVTAFALASLVGRPTELERAMLRRHLAIVLDGLRADGPAGELPPSPMSIEEFHTFVHRANGPSLDYRPPGGGA
ncbi:TetR/AcrR family transcriptional regulator [Demequina aestuarii]|uniref:TetR/AcrR family transcriptional regulator n=1 Tax=Demequina aestuarii TaxID=327095 RepID=UPI000A069EC3|nr:TetR/AcrR family transcriptional regulator [Demequina aestuarii]